MKNAFSYGFALALASALLGMALYFLGYTASPEKLESSKWATMGINLTLTVLIMFLGLRAKRDETPLTENWNYGTAFFSSLAIGIVAACFSAIFQYLYLNFIDPNIQNVMWQAQRAAMEAKGLSADKIDALEASARTRMSPVLTSIFALVGTVMSNVVIGLVASIFVRKRPEASAPEPAAEG